MAVINEYVDSSLVSTSARRRVAAQKAEGGSLVFLDQNFEVAAGDDDGSVYRVFKSIPSSAVFSSLRLACDAITSGTDYDIGLYLPDYGAVVDKDVLADGLNPSAGYTPILALDALKTVDLANFGKNLWELARDGAGALAYTETSHPAAFDICITANTVGSGAGTIRLFGSYYIA